jgi:hypothetical protein
VGLVTIDLLFPQAKDILDISVVVAAPEAHLRTRKAQKATKPQNATKGDKGQKSTKSATPTAAPSPTPSGAPTPCGITLPDNPLFIQSASTQDTLVAYEESIEFSSRAYERWEFNELDTCGEYTIRALELVASNKYMNGGSSLQGLDAGEVIISELWVGPGTTIPSELVWEVEQVAPSVDSLSCYSCSEDLNHYSIKSKSSGGYLDSTESLSRAYVSVKNDPNGVSSGLVGYQWFIGSASLD